MSQGPQLSKKVIIGIVAIGVAFGAVALMKKSSNPALEKIKADIVATNKSLPRMMDKSTRLDQVVLNNSKAVTYEFTVVTVNATTPQEITSNLKDKIIPGIKPRMLKDPAVITFLEQGISITYFYRNNEGSAIASVTATPKEYKESQTA